MGNTTEEVVSDVSIDDKLVEIIKYVYIPYTANVMLNTITLIAEYGNNNIDTIIIDDIIGHDIDDSELNSYLLEKVKRLANETLITMGINLTSEATLKAFYIVLSTIDNVLNSDKELIGYVSDILEDDQHDNIEKLCRLAENYNAESYVMLYYIIEYVSNSAIDMLLAQTKDITHEDEDYVLPADELLVLSRIDIDGFKTYKVYTTVVTGKYNPQDGLDNCIQELKLLVIEYISNGNKELLNNIASSLAVLSYISRDKTIDINIAVGKQYVILEKVLAGVSLALKEKIYELYNTASGVIIDKHKELHKV